MYPTALVIFISAPRVGHRILGSGDSMLNG